MSKFLANNFNFELDKKTYIMGILNLTPDSFSDGGRYNKVDLAIERAVQIQEEGASILDIGAQSTRPGCLKISEDEERERLIPALKEIKKLVKIPISIDTFYPKIAEEALSLGADIINDVSGFESKEMFEVVGRYKCGCIIMHNKSDTDKIKSFFEAKLLEALQYGIETERLCFDPGIGFNKNFEENIDIIKNIKKYRLPKNAFMIGASRKRLIGEACGNPPFEGRVYGTIAAHTVAILGGTDIIRVHDVKQAVQAAMVADCLR